MKFFPAILLLVIGFVSSYKKPFCKNCKHFIKNDLNDIYSKCSLFENSFYVDKDKFNSLVTGKKYNSDSQFYYCSTARESEEKCGIDGKFFTPKYPLNPLISREIIDM